MELKLSPEQADELRALVGAALTELHSEIHHTDSAEFRQRLLDRERLLTAVREQLRGGATTSER